MAGLFGRAIIAGVLTHQVIFIRGEWEKYTPLVAKIYGVVELLLSAYLLNLVFRDNEFYKPLEIHFTLFTGYLVGIFGSICTYRLFFHRLRDFPGPLGAKVSGFWSIIVSVPSFKFHQRVQELHKKHGDFVRIRPREISITNADAIRDIHGPGSVCVRGPFYDLVYPARSLQLTRDKVYHSKRRKLWDKGLSVSALKSYEAYVQRYSLALISQLSELGEQPVEITKWVNYFSFDIMGELSFGKSFQMVENDKTHFILPQMEEMKPVSGALTCVPWLFILVQSLPLVSAKRREWMEWCASQVSERKQVTQPRSDLFSHLIENTSNDEWIDLVSDSELAIVAGSDTAATALSAALFLLAKDPEKQELLRDEIDHLVAQSSSSSQSLPLSQEQLIEAKYLNGCINEALRLSPPVPSGMQRLTPKEGARIAGRWIPGDVLVSTPMYTIHRDPRYFSEPDSFIPDRWFSSKPGWVHRKDAFNPFLIGPYSCPGKALALMEMRVLLSGLIRTFSFQLVEKPGDNHNKNLLEDRYHDYFTAKLEPFELSFSKR